MKKIEYDFNNSPKNVTIADITTIGDTNITETETQTPDLEVTTETIQQSMSRKIIGKKLIMILIIVLKM